MSRYGRPSSATSQSSRLSQASQLSRSGEQKLECKAAYLTVLDDVRVDLTSKQDFISALQQAGRNPTQKMVKKYWDSERESMSFDEFVDVCRKEPPTNEDDLMKAFRKIDINGDGYISLDELYKLMTTKGERMSRDEVRMMIDEVDENKDGKLDYKEFCRMFISTAEECKKISLKVMEKKERRRKHNEAPTAAPRKDKDEGSVGGSQTSVQSAASEMRSRNFGSSTSLRSNDTLEGERKLSQASQRSAGHSGSRQSLLSIDDLPKPSPRGTKKTPVIARLPEPKGLKDWYHAKSKGCFFVDDKSFVSYQYELTLTEETSLWLTIQPIRIGDGTDRRLVDTAVFILRDEDVDDNALITFTEQRDSRGCHGVRCDLSAGKYTLIPFTTGCRLKPRKSEPTREAKLISKDKDDKIILTKPFKKALEEIFEISDLDGNGRLSREEFNWFNTRTSDDDVADDEWQVVEENVELSQGEITKQGFITLNEMEAEDNNGDSEDLWITLNNMGYNRALEMDEACPFLMDVYAEGGEVILKVTKLGNPGKVLENALCASVIAKGEASKVKAMKDLTMYTYVGDARATIVVENQSKTKVTMELDCSKSRNCVSNYGNLIATVDVPGHSKKVAIHLLPDEEKTEWSVRCTETILK